MTKKTKAAAAMPLPAPIPVRLFPEPELRVFLACPRCAYKWEAARVLPGVWWGKGVTAESVAKMCGCPNCQAPPPMAIEKPRFGALHWPDCPYCGRRLSDEEATRRTICSDCQERRG